MGSMGAVWITAPSLVLAFRRASNLSDLAGRLGLHG